MKIPKEGLRFQCQGSGKCCVSRGGYGYVYVNQRDRQRFAKHLKIPTRQFTRDYCRKTDGWYHLKDLDGPCIFLKGTRCSTYEARPTQCRTWPFWPENLKAKTWTKEVASYCPGIGKGPLIPAKEIQKSLGQDDWKK